MSDRKDAYVGQLVTANFYDECLAQLETADRNMTADAGFVGIYSGLGVTQNGSPNLTVNVATGTAYAPAGERMRAGTTTNVNCAVDRDGISTAVTNPINTRILAIVMRPDRILSDPQEDAGGDTVYTQRTESFAIEVIQGAEGAPAVAPSIDADAVLLADVTLIHGQTQILNASITTNDRRDDQIVVAGSPFALRTGKVLDAFSAVVARYNNHVGGFADTHQAGDIYYGGSGTWADGSTVVSAGVVEDAISEIVSDLASTTTSDAGGQRIGVQQDASVAPTLAASTLQARLVALRLATNLYYAGGPTWADSSSGPAAGTVEAAIDSIVSTIAASTGAAKMGMAAVGNFGAGTVQAMIAQLAATTTSNDGALRIGAQAVAGSYSSGTVRSQLDEVISGTQTITGAKTFDNITVSGTNKYKVASRSVTRTQTALLHNVTANVWDAGNINVNATASAVQDLNRIPHGATLTAVTTYHDRDNTGNLPGTLRVTLGLWKRNIVTGAITAIGITTEDPTSDVGDYEAHHGFSISGLSEVIDRTAYVYYAIFSGEMGTNSTFTSWFGCTATFTVTNNDEAQ